MKKLHLILLITAAFVAGGVAGGYVVNKLETNKPTSINHQAKADTTNRDKRSADKESGFDMTSTEMINELQSLPTDSTFDRKYINYIIATRSAEIGMARLALTSSTQPEIKQSAQEQIDQSEKLINTMYNWIKLWGFTDH